MASIVILPNESTTHEHHHPSKAPQKKIYIDPNMKCRARTWTGRCQHAKCQKGDFPHLCVGCSKKAEISSVPNTFDTDTLENGHKPKRIGLKFGTIDTPITELIFAPNGQIATVWPNDQVHHIVQRSLANGNSYHPGSKEARGTQRQKQPTNYGLIAPNNLPSVETSNSNKKIKIKIRIKKPSSPVITTKSNQMPRPKFIRRAIIRPDFTVDFGLGEDDSDDDQEDQSNHQHDTQEADSSTGEDPVEFLKNEIHQLGGIQKVKVNQLKIWLGILGLSTTGTKKLLQQRILEYLEADGSDSDTSDEEHDYSN
jgi:hypothetical protein